MHCFGGAHFVSVGPMYCFRGLVFLGLVLALLARYHVFWELVAYNVSACARL